MFSWLPSNGLLATWLALQQRPVRHPRLALGMPWGLLGGAMGALGGDLGLQGLLTSLGSSNCNTSHLKHKSSIKMLIMRKVVKVGVTKPHK